MDHGTLYIALACLFGFLMAWGIGANDVANAMGTAVGSKAITIKQAIIIAAIFEACGALFAGGQVTNTIGNNIVDLAVFAHAPNLLVIGMLAALLAAGSWLILASFMGWPVSTTHSIVGAIIGFGAVNLGVNAIHWEVVTSIALSWLATPVIAGFIAYFVFLSIQKFILNTETPFDSAKRVLPVYVFLVSAIIAGVTFSKGLQHLGLDLSQQQSLLYAIGFGLVMTVLGFFMLRPIQLDKKLDRSFHYASVEKVFAVLMVFIACTMAFAHGSNDVANAIGPLAAVINIVIYGGIEASNLGPPAWVLGLGAVGIVLGLAMYGQKVITTIGDNITQLTPSSGFAASIATASTVVLASGTGLPISTTQTLVGAILGVGFARGIGALNLDAIIGIFLSWVITLPIGAAFAILYFYILNYIFSH